VVVALNIAQPLLEETVGVVAALPHQQVVAGIHHQHLRHKEIMGVMVTNTVVAVAVEQALQELMAHQMPLLSHQVTVATEPRHL
jgi:hypothetical protein